MLAKKKKTTENLPKEARSNEENGSANFTSPKKRKRPTPVTDFFDHFNEDALRRTILSYYERNEIPTVDKIYEEIKNKLSYTGGRETLRKVMKKLFCQDYLY